MTATMRIRWLLCIISMATVFSGTPSSAFEAMALGEYFSFDPPDTQLAVGPSHVLQVNNRRYRVFDRNGAELAKGRLQDLVGCPNGNAFDPRAMYDSLSGRFFVAATETPVGSSRVCLAVSTTSSALDPFVYYNDLYVPPAYLATLTFDFPVMGTTSDKLVITSILRNPIPNQPGGPLTAIVLNKADLLAGVAARRQVLLIGTGPLVFPMNALDNTIQDSFLIGPATNELWAWNVRGVPGVGSGVQDPPVLTRVATASTGGNVPTVPQKGTNDQLVVGGARDVVYRNGTIWHGASLSCTPSGDTVVRPCLRLFQLQVSGQTINAPPLQDITYGVAGMSYFFPALTTDPAGNLFVLFGAGSPSIYPSSYATGRRTTDAVNTLRPATVVQAGQMFYGTGGGFAGWGDYFAAVNDPNDQNTVWYSGQYAQFPAPRWSTFVLTDVPSSHQ